MDTVTLRKPDVLRKRPPRRGCGLLSRLLAHRQKVSARTLWSPAPSPWDGWPVDPFGSFASASSEAAAILTSVWSSPKYDGQASQGWPGRSLRGSLTTFLKWTRETQEGFARLVADEAHPRHFLSVGEWNDSTARQAWADEPRFLELFMLCLAVCDDVQSSQYEVKLTF
jgi:hypothetical protein